MDVVIKSNECVNMLEKTYSKSNGIYCEQTNNILIEDNYFHITNSSGFQDLTGYAIYFDNVTNAIVSGNTFKHF